MAQPQPELQKFALVRMDLVQAIGSVLNELPAKDVRLLLNGLEQCRVVDEPMEAPQKPTPERKDPGNGDAGSNHPDQAGGSGGKHAPDRPVAAA